MQNKTKQKNVDKYWYVFNGRDDAIKFIEDFGPMTLKAIKNAIKGEEPKI